MLLIISVQKNTLSLKSGENCCQKQSLNYHYPLVIMVEYAIHHGSTTFKQVYFFTPLIKRPNEKVILPNKKLY